VVGLSFDQKLTERLGLFGRASVGRKSAYSFWQFYSLGFNLSSPFPSRPEDSFAFGVAALVPSPLYSKHSTEVHLETYYRANLSDYLFLSPDLQVVLNPGGDGNAEPIYAFTLKLGVEF
jgi:carbohydrate-selective porin OprB